MATITKHAPGTFCWPELGTTDQDGAKKFYAGIFGWTFSDMPMGPDAGVYTIFKNHGQDAAALFTLMADLRKQGIPPHWGAYIATSNADETAQRAASLGGKVIMQPFDVMGTMGRMAVLQDPTGAIFSVWQAKDHPGVGVHDEPGALTWTELATPDPAKAEKFYVSLMGWKTEKSPMPTIGEYTAFKRPDGTRAGGMMKMTPEMEAGNVPPHWLTYFATADLQATLNKARSLGATVVMPPTAIKMGQFAIANDPQGAPFGLLQFAA